jgi:hypothetical protein
LFSKDPKKHSIDEGQNRFADPVKKPRIDPQGPQPMPLPTVGGNTSAADDTQKMDVGPDV